MYDWLLFMLMYMISFHLVINSDDWFLVWLGLEINMMMFIMLIYERYDMYNMESCLKYFFIQSLGSAILMSLFYLNKEYMNMILCMVLSYKIGAGPFFYWFPSVCSGISWMSCFILMSIQKLIPLMLISMFISLMLFVIIMMSLVFGILGSFNQNNLKQLIAYSSVYHLGWIMLCVMFNNMSWFTYLILYSILIFPMIYFMKWFNVMTLLENMKTKHKVLLIILMMSMAGMPPFLGFFLKWFAFINIMKYNFYMGIMLVVSSIVMFYIYFRVIYDGVLWYYNDLSWGNMMMLKNGKKLDLMSIMGMMFGLMLSLYLMY